MAYTTRQHQAILRCLAQRGEEPLSAAELAEALRAAGCPVGLATVYRQLGKLEAAGCVHRVDTEEGALYRYCDRPEDARDCFLLKCEGCGRILHLDCTHLRPLYEHLEQQHHFRIDPRRTVFTGLCDVCAAAQGEKENHSGAR